MPGISDTIPGNGDHPSDGRAGETIPADRPHSIMIAAGDLIKAGMTQRLHFECTASLPFGKAVALHCFIKMDLAPIQGGAGIGDAVARAVGHHKRQFAAGRQHIYLKSMLRKEGYRYLLLIGVYVQVMPWRKMITA